MLKTCWIDISQIYSYMIGRDISGFSIQVLIWLHVTVVNTCWNLFLDLLKKNIYLVLEDLFICLSIQDCGVRAFCPGCNNKILHVTVVDTSWNLYIFSLPPKFKHRIPGGNSKITICRVQVFFLYFAPLLILFVPAAASPAIFPTPKSSRCPILDKKRGKTCLLRLFNKDKIDNICFGNQFPFFKF